MRMTWSAFLPRAGLLSLLLAAAPGEAEAAILGIAYGNAVLGSHSGNLVANGSFETGAAGNQMWTGNGPYTGANVGGPGVAIPSWNASYPTGAYGWWGPIPFGGAPCTDGANRVYFGNWITSASQVPSFGANGEVTFSGPVTFTNTVAANQGQVTLAQTLALVVGTTYLLDFWTTGEGPPILSSGVFGLDIGSQSGYLEAVTGTRRYCVTFIADAASTTIAFTNWGHLQTGSGVTTELTLDDVIVNAMVAAVPEPGMLGLVAAGRPRGALRRAPH